MTYDISKVSPRPWRKDPEQPNYGDILDSTGEAVIWCSCDCGGMSLGEIDEIHILHCVNLHDDLVTALEKVIDIVDNTHEDWYERRKGLEVDLVKLQDDYREDYNTVIKAKATLAKARGEK